jgi:hypothetical protein
VSVFPPNAATDPAASAVIEAQRRAIETEDQETRLRAIEERFRTDEQID